MAKETNNNSSEETEARQEPVSIAKDFSRAVLERINSPLAGTYLFFLLFFNWELVAPYIFDQATLELVGIIIPDTEDSREVVDYLWPLAATLIYLLLYPWGHEIATRYRTIAIAFASTLGETIDTKIAKKRARQAEARAIDTAKLANLDELAKNNKEVVKIRDEIKEAEQKRSALTEQLRNIRQKNEDLESQEQALQKKHQQLLTKKPASNLLNKTPKSLLQFEKAALRHIRKKLPTFKSSLSTYNFTVRLVSPMEEFPYIFDTTASSKQTNIFEFLEMQRFTQPWSVSAFAITINKSRITKQILSAFIFLERGTSGSASVSFGIVELANYKLHARFGKSGQHIEINNNAELLKILDKVLFRLSKFATTLFAPE